MSNSCCQQVQVTPRRRVEVAVTVMRGEKGSKGDKGDKGDKGEKGDSMVVETITEGDIAKLF